MLYLLPSSFFPLPSSFVSTSKLDAKAGYRQIIQQILENHASIPYSHGQIEQYVIIDSQKNNFLLMNIGWDGQRRIHGCVVHVEIRSGKIWIQRDGIEEGITGELVNAGIPKEQIVLAFHPIEVRPHTGFAIA